MLKDITSNRLVEFWFAAVAVNEKVPEVRFGTTPPPTTMLASSRSHRLPLAAVVVVAAPVFCMLVPPVMPVSAAGGVPLA